MNARKFQKYERPQKPRVIREGFLKKVILKLGGAESFPLSRKDASSEMWSEFKPCGP